MPENLKLDMLELWRKHKEEMKALISNPSMWVSEALKQAKTEGDREEIEVLREILAFITSLPPKTERPSFRF